jgi:hypothetical protein
MDWNTNNKKSLPAPGGSAGKIGARKTISCFGFNIGNL